MPQENVPTSTATAQGAPTTASTGSAPSLLGRLGFSGCAALVVLVLVALVVPLALRSEGSTDFPRVAPEDMADRAFQRSQEAYDVLGFTRSVKPGFEEIGVSTENTFGSGLCYDGGPLGMEDKTVDGAYSANHSWALDHVPADRAQSGLRRLHQHLKDDGWTVSSYREGVKGKDWDLFVQRDDGDERMSFTWYADREYFTGGASVPCAYDPAWKTGDAAPSADAQWPPTLRPSR
ncbi:hypothetical protein [Streptomyces sp. NPDC058644]|uniref:hypothetical protein n=1 Tax=unclassified Streptomyces TaxID=2593676 RepID=UPI00364F5382